MQTHVRISISHNFRIPESIDAGSLNDVDNDGHISVADIGVLARRLPHDRQTADLATYFVAEGEGEEERCQSAIDQVAEDGFDWL